MVDNKPTSWEYSKNSPIDNYGTIVNGGSAITTITPTNPTGFLQLNPDSNDEIVSRIFYSIDINGKVTYALARESDLTLTDRRFNNIQEIARAGFPGYDDNTTLRLKDALSKNLKDRYKAIVINNEDGASPYAQSGQNQPDPPGPDTSNTQLTPISDLNQISGSATDGKFDPLKYPYTPAVGDKFDYLKIDVIKYVPPGLGVKAEFNVKRFDEPGGGGRETVILGSVFLPMQPGITDSNGASWNEDRLNPFQIAFGGTAAQALNDFGAGKIGEGITNLFGNIKNVVSRSAASGNVQDYLTSYFAGQAVGANIITRRTGAVINNNLELLFNGPKLRTFQYNFRFTPRDGDEAGVIKKIIRVFKRNLAPSQTKDGLFLASPNVFRLKYIYANTQEQHPFLNKIGTCALTDMSVNYTPDGTYMTYGEDGSMTSYTMTLQFSELNPIYREDYDTTEGQQGMGY